MVPEIDLLIKYFEGQPWNTENQRAFMQILREENFFNGEGANDPAFSARDRINRAPKALGFISLSPVIQLLPAGTALLNSKRQNEVFLRQMLKYQIPSPYHKPSSKAADFWVKPYLELLRLVRKMGTLKFDELQIFGMQLTNWHNFNQVVDKIKEFRKAKLVNTGNYKKLKVDCMRRELFEMYSDRIAQGETKTRESGDRTVEKFIQTQANNLRDYADACFRYLRATGLVNVSHVGKSLSIVPERVSDVDYILKHVDRNPCFVDDEEKYVAYLGNANIPALLTDNRRLLLGRLAEEFPKVKVPTNGNTENLKDFLTELVSQRKENTIQHQSEELKQYKQYDDVQHMFLQIAEDRNMFERPLMLEWNTWRAMTMMDGGDIKANLKFDDFGNPMSTAQGNMADIICDYGDFCLAVEVTMSSGQTQYNMESEPVSRHLGKLKKETGKPCYGLFIAPTINEACVAHFYGLHNLNIKYYGGKSTIVPLPLHIFQKMLEDSYNADYTPTPQHVRRFFEYSNDLVKQGVDEDEWFAKMQERAVSWAEI